MSTPISSNAALRLVPDKNLVVDQSINMSVDTLFKHQFQDGFWWYSLEANDSINAEYIFLMHYMECIDLDVQKAISLQIINNQNEDGSWSIFYGGDGDLSTTIECYLALKLSGISLDSESLTRARRFILMHGGLSQIRIFSRIHLAQFGIIPWSACPVMPAQLIKLPSWFPINIYEFSSWARSCIVPLLVIMAKKRMIPLGYSYLNELYAESDCKDVDWSYSNKASIASWDQFFITLDKAFKKLEKFGLKYYTTSSLADCEAWIRQHIEKTEDIYPALAYSAMALKSLGYGLNDPTVKKCMDGLKKFQMKSNVGDLHFLPRGSKDSSSMQIYQQCCLSPVWDTPWALEALLDAGVSTSDNRLTNSGNWLISKQVLNTYGDWSQKNKKALPGGWSFEFENEYFPDVDDTLQILKVLQRIDLDEGLKEKALARGLNWLLSMQCKNGGWAAFDINNTLELVNKIPFSDHGACLDPPSPDITGRILELLGQFGFAQEFQPVKKAIRFIESTQEEDGSWFGRWGVNYIYGTWCVLKGLNKINYNLDSQLIQKAVKWLKSVQKMDGGFGESCDSYKINRYLPLDESTASQTSWALMGLLAGEKEVSPEAHKAAQYLIKSQKNDGTWDEPHFTGTGFPGHFYIRYHGYRHYFPLLALAQYRQSL
ncbi:MAG: hypothetical protein ACD_73C00155G0001 [uncultured bacterium]|nr:MAG: hypothetical protein ACD_73C00155G0001 [uncultured bacterium]